MSSTSQSTDQQRTNERNRAESVSVGERELLLSRGNLCPVGRRYLYRDISKSLWANAASLMNTESETSRVSRKMLKGNQYCNDGTTVVIGKMCVHFGVFFSFSFWLLQQKQVGIVESYYVWVHTNVSKFIHKHMRLNVFFNLFVCEVHSYSSSRISLLSKSIWTELISCQYIF